ncbi:hypothetical protein GCM10022384_53070 [Streptomyces marokkonensis]|uniref:Uncharacterized protein n=1 Tax=Streptomyces marokkonensis TaxID=324855 RepID=A0ABP7RM07_9ACTN
MRERCARMDRYAVRRAVVRDAAPPSTPASAAIPVASGDNLVGRPPVTAGRDGPASRPVRREAIR